MKNHYTTIAKAIEFIQANSSHQPSLKQIAEHVHLSESQLQKVFTKWAGVSPKQFLKFINVQYAKQLLQHTDSPSLFEVSEQAGLSSSSRLHDLFITVEGMTPGQYKNLGESLTIEYEFCDTLFGNLLIASTPVGICYLGFNEHNDYSIQDLTRRYELATFTKQGNSKHQQALKVFKDDWQNLDKIKLNLKGTDFQLKVWHALLTIPQGDLCTYGDIAKKIKRPKASRAVGTAIGSNPISILIPCHRVIQQTGLIGGYMWGTTRKTAIIGWEAAQKHHTK